jgi:predicted transcriptional regulator of viral defense system
MEQTGVLQPVKGVGGLYVIASEAASVNELELAQECNPQSVVSHLSAIHLHRLTDSFPNEIHLVTPAGTADQTPPGIPPHLWGADVGFSVKAPQVLEGVPVYWHRRLPKLWFGNREALHGGVTLATTDLERTLLDALEKPAWSGGFSTVLEAWRNASAVWNLDRLVEYTERIGSPLGRQRVGFLVEALGLNHHCFDKWAKEATRGGANKLLASEPYAPTFSERWKISLNTPLDRLKGAP